VVDVDVDREIPANIRGISRLIQQAEGTGDQYIAADSAVCEPTRAGRSESPRQFQPLAG
jgi:hypothetical protein